VTDVSRRLLPLLAVVVLAACTSTTNGVGHASPSRSSSSPTTSHTSGPGVDLHALVLQRADVPSDWTDTPNTDTTDEDQAVAQGIVQCLGLHLDPNAGRLAHVNSDDFVKNDSRIGSSAESWRSETDVQAQIAIITNPRAGHCYAQVLRNQLPSNLPANVTLDTLQVTLTPGHAGFPDDVVATGHGKIVLSSGGQSASLYLDAAFIAHGTVTGQVQFLGLGEQILPTLSSQLVQTVADRIARA
jgi:hypothetical protein